MCHIQFPHKGEYTGYNNYWRKHWAFSLTCIFYYCEPSNLRTKHPLSIIPSQSSPLNHSLSIIPPHISTKTPLWITSYHKHTHPKFRHPKHYDQIRNIQITTPRQSFTKIKHQPLMLNFSFTLRPSRYELCDALHSLTICLKSLLR